MVFRSTTSFPGNSTEILVTVIGSGIVLVVVAKLVRRIFGEKENEYPNNVVILFQTPRTPEVPNLSPFAIKLETYLRMASIPYQNEYCLKMSPKHKTPWIMYNGQVYSDSQFIIEFLNKEFDVDLSKHLTPKEKAIAHSMRKMTEESLYWVVALSRWVYDYDESHLEKQFQLSIFTLWRIQSAVKEQAYYQGYGRHSEEEGEIICRQDLEALSNQIGQNMFLMGNQPCEADSAVFGMLAMLWMMPESNFITQLLKDNIYPNLTTYVENMKKEFWPDYKQIKSDEAEENVKTS